MADESSSTGLITAEEALRRAKEIAAKLSGQISTTLALDDVEASGFSSPQKRKRWGVMPVDEAPETTTTDTATAMKETIEETLKRVKQSSSYEMSAQKRVWVKIDGKPRAHYRSYLRNHMHEIYEKVTEQVRRQLNITDSSVEVVKLDLQGRGASKEPPVAGMPEQPLHVYIEGVPEATPLAGVLVEQALLDAHDAEVSQEDLDQQKLEQQQAQLTASTSDPNSALVAIQSLSADGLSHLSSGGAYRPTSVAQLIGVHNSNLPSIDINSSIEEDILVPHSVVGLIIGRGGESIANLQVRTQCKVQIQKESDLQPGQTSRIITLTASTQEAVDAARSHIQRLVQERTGNNGGGSTNTSISPSSLSGPTHYSVPTNYKDASAAKVAEAVATGHVHIQVSVPEEDVGLVIGKQGVTIRSMQENTGANIQIPGQTPGQQFRLIDITHPTQIGAAAAQQQIQDLLNSKTRNAYNSFRSNGTGGMGGAHVTIQVSIPDKDIGLCIGRQGSVIRYMQSTTQTRIQIPSYPVPGELFRIASISGSSEGTQQAKHMIETIVAEQSSVNVIGGGSQGVRGIGGASTGYTYYSGQNQAQQQMGGGQQAYSAEWAAYHAAQAAAQAAAVAQQQAAAPAPATATIQQQHPQLEGAEAYREQFFRYAYYYGEDAARQYYGAWSPPVGTSNPYGVNPNGIQPIPAPTASTTSTSVSVTADPNDPLIIATMGAAATDTSDSALLQQQQQSAQTRETSRRNVSNLPAWMTQG